ncbi:MAG: hypothetical protein ABJC09_12480 [Terriglobia bacterium]
MVTLTWYDGAQSLSQIVNMEEIWVEGAVLECEESVTAGVQASIEWGGFRLAGLVAEAAAHEFGWRVELEFSPQTPWSPEAAPPAHMYKSSRAS